MFDILALSVIFGVETNIFDQVCLKIVIFIVFLCLYFYSLLKSEIEDFHQLLKFVCFCHWPEVGQYISKLESGPPHHRGAGTGRREARARASGPAACPYRHPWTAPSDPRTSWFSKERWQFWHYFWVVHQEILWEDFCIFVRLFDVVNGSFENSSWSSAEKKVSPASNCSDRFGQSLLRKALARAGTAPCISRAEFRSASQVQLYTWN